VGARIASSFSTISASSRTTFVIPVLLPISMARDGGLEQFFDLVFSKIDQREGTASWTRERRIEVKAEAIVDRGDYLCVLDGVFGGVRADGVALADGPA